jgi:UDPglucose 6-dehydrogenase
VTAACLAEAGYDVRALDLDTSVVADLNAAHAPVREPGLDELLGAGISRGNLHVHSSPAAALRDAEILWVTFDTPVDDDDHADPGWVRAQLDTVRAHVNPHTLVIVSSQIPVGFTRKLQGEWSAEDATLSFACSPENLRLGQALKAFRSPERVIVGLGERADDHQIGELVAPFSGSVEWMSLESAEMTKHALNSFLAMSVAYANELARICERVGAEAHEVERGLRTDPRVGARAYVSPGPAFAGGTLARDISFLTELASQQGLQAPLFEGVRRSNELQKNWTREHVQALLADLTDPRVALLGLTYKPETSTLRRSSSVELGKWLAGQGVTVCAYDPAISQTSPELGLIHLVADVPQALTDADLLVLATPWPAFRDVSPDLLIGRMRAPRVVDPAGYLGHLAEDDRVTYVSVGRPDPAWSLPS